MSLSQMGAPISSSLLQQASKSYQQAPIQAVKPPGVLLSATHRALGHSKVLADAAERLEALGDRLLGSVFPPEPKTGEAAEAPAGIVGELHAHQSTHDRLAERIHVALARLEGMH